MIKPKGKDQYAKAVEYSHTLEELLIMERENSAALRDELAAAERERDEFKALAECQSQLAGRNAARAQKAEEEITRRDAAASKPTAWVCGDDEIRDFKAGREVTIVRDCDDSDLEYLPLYLTAPPAVLPPLKKITASVPTDWHKGVVCGWNGCIEMALRLGTQQQKPVVLPEPHAHLIWIKAGRGADDYWDDVEVSRSDKDRCCDGSERYAVYSEFEVKSMLDAANVKWEVKK